MFIRIYCDRIHKAFSKYFSDIMETEFKTRTMGCNEDIEAERKTATFDVEELTNLIDDGPENTSERREIENFFLQNEKFKVDYDPYSLTYDENYCKSLELGIELEKTIAEYNFPGQLPGNLQYIRSPHLSALTVPMDNPILVHILMFTPTVLFQGTEEQIARWLPLIKSNQIKGAYAQTELGHGTNMRGLETTAHFDEASDEFILHSPTLTSIKFWPGGLGKTSNFAVVTAQLYIKSKGYGIHLFLVQLRSLKNHSPLPGITVGDLGPKMGCNSSDNGFLRLNQVRIPRNQMLMKNAQVLRDGTYVKPKQQHSGYATLVLARVGLVAESPLRLAQAVTIAIRYSVIRRQGEIVPGTQEVKILDYKTQQYKLIPQVAVAFGLCFTFKALRLFLLSNMTNTSPEIIAELHALSSGLKSLCTQAATSGTEQCRLACGGLGYMLASRLPHLYASLNGYCTLDGENTILLLQTAKYLMKSVKNVKTQNILGSSVQYLDPSHDKNINQPLNELTSIYQRTTSRLIYEVSDKMEKQIEQGKLPEIVWNENSVHLLKCAKLHCQVFVMQTLSNLLCEINVSHALRNVLTLLFELLGLYWIHENYGDFLRYGDISHQNFDSMYERLLHLLSELRPQVVSLVDAFDFRDEALRSILGGYDGRVYERVYEYIQNLPSNKKKVHEVFKHLQSNLKSQL